MVSCSSGVSHPFSSAPILANFTNQRFLDLAQAQQLMPSCNLSLGTAQPDQRAPSPAAFDNLELRLWHGANDDRSNFSQSVPGTIKVVWCPNPSHFCKGCSKPVEGVHNIVIFTVKLVVFPPYFRFPNPHWLCSFCKQMYMIFYWQKDFGTCFMLEHPFRWKKRGEKKVTGL